MNRRIFLKSTAAAAAAASLPWREAVANTTGEWRSYEIVTRVTILKPEGTSKAWIPLPMMDETEWHRPGGSSWTGNASKASVLRDGKYGAPMMYAEWTGQSAPVIEVTSSFMSRDRQVDPTRRNPNAEKLSPADVAFYTAATELIPTDGIVKQTSRDVTKGAKTDVDKARAIYEWVVENTFRDPKTRGCGWGDIKSMLETRNFGGKCGDLNAMFVGLSRAAGVPARDIYGLRVAPSIHNYRSLGVGNANVTRAQHCRAEFYAQGVGWVPVDPADVRKVVLEEPPTNLKIDHPMVVAARKRLFGGWEMNWLAYNMAHDLKLPGSSGPKVPYFMYINGETGGKMLDPLEPDVFKYEIRSNGVKA
jgi:transglutaminase-like putative cysteine protease